MPTLHAKRFVLEFAMPEPVALRALCDERGYDKPTQEKPYASKTLDDGSIIEIRKDEPNERIVVCWNGPVEHFVAIRSAIDVLYEDLVAIGLTPPAVTS